MPLEFEPEDDDEDDESQSPPEMTIIADDDDDDDDMTSRSIERSRRIASRLSRGSLGGGDFRFSDPTRDFTQLGGVDSMIDRPEDTVGLGGLDFNPPSDDGPLGGLR